MQNIYIQIAIGLLPAAIFFLVCGFLRKSNKVRNFVMAGVFVITVSIIAIPQLVSNGSKRANEEGYDGLSLVYALADEGSYDVALTLLKDLRTTNYIPEYTLAEARIAMLSGDYTTGLILYEKANFMLPDITEEHSNAVTICKAQSEFFGISSQTDIDAMNSTFYNEADKSKKYTANVIENEVKNYDKSIKRIATGIAYAEQKHSDYINGSVTTTSEIERQLKKLEDALEDNPSFLAVPQVRIARLKLQILNGDFKDIAASLDENSDYNELMIVSELFMNGYVKQSNFTGVFSKGNVEKYQAVYDKLNNALERMFQNKDERKTAESQLKLIKEIIKNPAWERIKEALLKYANKKNADDASKVFLQLAKIEYAKDNEEKAYEYINRSIDTVGECDDDDYTVPMYSIMGIITDKDSPERLKDAAGYVDEVIDNNMIVKSSDLQNSQGSNEEIKTINDDFATHIQTFVSQKRMSVNIVAVDTTQFENNKTIKATVNISNNLYTSTQELKEAMTVKDCGVDITGFEVEKVQYSGANILLCVDSSGSMMGDKIENLKNAIKLFAAEKSNMEDIALVTFSNEVIGDYPFGMTIEELNNASNSIYASGGTAVYYTLQHSLSKFTNETGVINTVILMTDGIDGYTASLEEIKKNIGIPCTENNITVYTIGFGSDADGTYLNNIAAETGGTYLYANDPSADSQVNQLEEFFSGLRAQILNQYTVTFKAVDTLSYTRDLKIAVGSDLDSDTVTYYLGGGSDSTTEPEYDGDSPVFSEGKAIYGFEPRLLYKNGRTQQAELKGEGFENSDRISVALKGRATGMEWELGCEFVDANTISVTIPSGIGIDVYDVYVVVNGKTAVLAKGISIFKQGSEKVTDFGKYRFVSYIQYKKKNEITLSGCVNMNGWLDFKGDVILTGDFKSSSINIYDAQGCYVAYDGINSEGLARALYYDGYKVTMPALGTVTIYNEEKYENQNAVLRVDIFRLDRISFGSIIQPTSIDVGLYPNMISFEADSFIADLPFAKKILKNKFNLFSFDFELNGTISSKNIGIKLDTELNAGSSSSTALHNVNLGNIPLNIAPKDVEIHLDTLENEFEFKFAIKLNAIKSVESFGLGLKWGVPKSSDDDAEPNNRLQLTAIEIAADFDINATVGGVPITYSDFIARLENIDASKSPVYWTLIGGCDISACKISQVPGLSGLDKWIGDVSVIKLDDCELTLCLGEFYIKAKTTLKIFEEVDCGSAVLELGKFAYTSRLLGMDDETVVGFRVATTLGPNWEIDDSHIKLQITGEFDVLNKFIGIAGKGELDLKFKLWIVCIKEKLQGEFAVGIIARSDGKAVFVIKADPKLPVGDITWPKNVAGTV